MCRGPRAQASASGRPRAPLRRRARPTRSSACNQTISFSGARTASHSIYRVACSRRSRQSSASSSERLGQSSRGGPARTSTAACESPASTRPDMTSNFSSASFTREPHGRRSLRSKMSSGESPREVRRLTCTALTAPPVTSQALPGRQAVQAVSRCCDDRLFDLPRSPQDQHSIGRARSRLDLPPACARRPRPADARQRRQPAVPRAHRNAGITHQAPAVPRTVRALAPPAAQQFLQGAHQVGHVGAFGPATTCDLNDTADAPVLSQDPAFFDDAKRQKAVSALEKKAQDARHTRCG